MADHRHRFGAMSKYAFVTLGSVLLTVAVAQPAGAQVELRDAELVAGGSPVLENGLGTVRLEDGRLGRLGPPVFVPEPGAVWQLGSGAGLLALLSGRRRRRAPPTEAGAPSSVHVATRPTSRTQRMAP